MQIKTVPASEWIFPDSEIGAERRAVRVDIPRGGDDCFQVLTDFTAEGGEAFSFEADLPAGVSVEVRQIVAVRVLYNTAPDHHETHDWEIARAYATRKAPFDVYDRVCGPARVLEPGRAVFLVRINAAESAAPGEYGFSLRLCPGDQAETVSVTAAIHATLLHRPEESEFTMCHWIYNEAFTYLHDVPVYSEAFFGCVEKYLRILYDMRNNFLQLPTADPIRDESGKVTGFDFSGCARIAAIAKRIGFRTIAGGFVVGYRNWRWPDLYLRWDPEVEAHSLEGARQLKLYFNTARRFVEENGLEGCYQQTLMDEPHRPNAYSYIAVSSICRACLPGIVIADPVETPAVLGGVDYWCVKQEDYEKEIEEYQALQAMGEKFWFYTCGFPGGDWMNHILDIPLNGTRLTSWMGVRYRMTGFLHYGFMDFCEGMDPLREGPSVPVTYHGELRHLPAGDSALIYASKTEVFQSLRAHNQRLAAAEGELLLRYQAADPENCDRLIETLCTGFHVYTKDAAAVTEARRTLLDRLDALNV